MKNQKAQINQVFVYLLSIIMILFIGFLVTKFIIGLNSDTKTISENKFFETLQNDYDDVFRTFGSEKVLEYRVSSQIKEICFSENKICTNTLELSNQKKTNYNISIDSNSNIAIFDENDLIQSKNIGEFQTNDDCFCVKPNNGRFELILENRRNEVFINVN